MELVDRKRKYDKQNGEGSQSGSEDFEKEGETASNAPQWEFEDDDEKKPETESKKDDGAKPRERERSHKKHGEKRERKKREKKPTKKPTSSDPQKAKALRTIIHPSIENVAKTAQDEKVLGALQELKAAFDMAENIQPGTSHNFIAQVIDALKKSSQQQQH